jgi:hypothetical protein
MLGRLIGVGNRQASKLFGALRTIFHAKRVNIEFVAARQSRARESVS